MTSLVTSLGVTFVKTLKKQVSYEFNNPARQAYPNWRFENLSDLVHPNGFPASVYGDTSKKEIDIGLLGRSRRVLYRR
jgi:hypothetical protein